MQINRELSVKMTDYSRISKLPIFMRRGFIPREITVAGDRVGATPADDGCGLLTLLSELMPFVLVALYAVASYLLIIWMAE